MRSLLPRLLLLLVAVALVGLRPAGMASADRIKDGEDDNYALHIPDSWVFAPVDDLGKLGVKVAANRRLETLADGKTAATGEGGRILLSVQDVPKDFEPDYETWVAEWQMLEAEAQKVEEVPEALDTKIKAAREKIDKAIAGLAARDEVKSLLLNRWDKDPKKWPPHEVDGNNVEISRVPAAEVKAHGPCPNLAAEPGECEGRLFVWVIRKKMYRLAMWAWHTKHDREHLKDDLDTIELSFEVPKPTAIPKKPVAPPAASDLGDGPKLEGDAAESKVTTDLAFGFRVLKPKKFKSVPVDRAKVEQRELGFRFEAVQGPSSALVDLLVYRIKGATTAFNLDNYLKGLWTAFLAGHPKGALSTAPFPAVGPKAPFLSLPDLAKKKEVKRTEAGDNVSVPDMERFGVISEAKLAAIRKEKVKGGWRFCMDGLTERTGEEMHLHYAFSTDERTYVLRVTVRKEGWGLWKEEISELLKSFEILDEPK